MPDFDEIVLTADVLVVGGGPAGTGVWSVEPDPSAREAAMASWEALGGYLADRRWMGRVLDETYRRVTTT